MSNVQLIDDFGPGNQSASEKLIQVFQNSKFGEVRIKEIDGIPHFVANDVAKALGYTNPSKATNDHCKKGIMMWGNDSLGRRQEFKFIPEGDIYRLVVKSQLPIADEFESWIFDEVLPSIRKNGIYATDVTIDNIIDNPDFGISLLNKLKKEREEKVKLYADLETKNKIIEIQEGELKVQAPLVKYTKEVLSSDSLTATTIIAKDLGFTSAEKFNQELIKQGILNRQKISGCFVINAKYAGKGYTHTKTHRYTDSKGDEQTSKHLYWTEKGIMFLNWFFSNNTI